MDESWLLFFFVGLFAQLVDGALGMAFGVTATTVMLSFGTAPAQASAMVHIAEIFTTAASGASHWWHRNVDWTIVRRIAIPGTIGGILGATLLSNVDGKVIAPFVTVYLALMGVLILFCARNTQVHRCRADSAWHARRRFQRRRARRRRRRWMGSDRDKHAGRRRPRPALRVGSVNLTEFFVTFATSATFIVTLGLANLAPVIPLVFGGVVSAPFAGYLVKIVSNRLLMLIVGSLILALSARTL